MGSAPASLADNPFLITLLLEMQTTIFLRTEMSRKTEYVHNPCFLSANILKILGVFAENQREFLYEAIYIPEGVKPPSKDVVDLPELKLYIEDFGKKKDDFCLVADCEGKVVGAVWVRIMNDYGHVDDRTPSLSISLYKEYRSKGIGSHLMREMFRLLESKGYSRVSLSVQKANYAVRMYLKLGFKIIHETEEEFVMLKDLSLSY